MKIKRKFFIVVYKKLTSLEEKKLNEKLIETQKIIPSKSKLYLVDMSKFYFGNKFIFKEKFINRKLNYIKVANLSVLNNLSKGYKCYCFGFTNRNLNEFLVLYLLKKYKIKLLGFSDVGFFANIPNYKQISFILKLRFIFYFRLNYFIYRFLLSLRLTPPIEYFFESSGSRIRNIIDLEKKKNFFLKFFFPSYFKKLIRINSRFSDLNLKKNKEKEKLVLYIDSGLGHEDVKKLNFKNDIKYLSYYIKLINFLKKIKKKNKKIVVCLHPRAKYPKNVIKLLKKNFTIKIGTKDIYIWQSEYTIINMSSMLNKLIFFRKKIIIANSLDLGNWINKKIINLNNEIKLCNVNLDDKIYSVDKLFKKSSETLKLYDNFIKKNLIENNSQNYFENIKSKLEKI